MKLKGGAEFILSKVKGLSLSLSLSRKPVVFVILLFLFLSSLVLIWTQPIYKVHASSTITISDSGGTRNWNDPLSWVGGVVPTSIDDVIATATSGNLTINVAAACKSINLTNYTGILTHNAFTLTVSGLITFVAGMTYTPLWSSTVIMASDGTLTTGGKLMPNVTVSAGTMTLGDNLGFMASNRNSLTISGTALDLNGKTILGNSSINRILITSGTLGSSGNLIVSGSTFTNADFRDIAFNNGGADLNLSAITGLSGDCGGNGMISGGNLTLTTSTNQTWTNANGGAWSLSTNWTSRTPLPQDDISMAKTFLTSKTVSIDMPRLGKNINWTGATWTTSLTWSGSMSHTIYGSLTMVPGLGEIGTYDRAFEGRSDFTLTSAGLTFARAFKVNMVGGSLTLQDNFNSTAVIQINNGTFAAGSHAVTCTTFSSSTTVARSVMGTGLWTFTGTGVAWSSVGDNLTLDVSSATFVISNTSATLKQFLGGGQTFGNLTISGDNVKIDYDNFFNTLAVNNAGLPTGLVIVSGKIQTVNNFTTNASSGSLAKITASIAGSPATIKKATSGFISVDYLSLKDSTASPAVTWYAGTHSTNVSGNSGWTFRDPITISNAGGNWSSNATWVGGVIPTSVDDVFASATSGNVTIDADASCRNLDLTGYTGTLTHNAGVTLSIGNATGGTLKMASGMTYTPLDNATSIIAFISTTTGNTITWAGKGAGSIIFNGIGGGWVLQDTATINGGLTITNSETAGDGVNINNQAVTINGSFQMDAGKLTLGSSAVNIIGNWVINGGSQVPNTSTLTFSGVVPQSITTSGQPFYNVTVTNTTAGGVAFTDSAIIRANLTDTTASSKLVFNSGSNYTIGTLNISGADDSHRVALQASGVANWNIDPVNIIQSDYLDISKSTNIGKTFCATNSNDGGGNSNWYIATSSSCWANYSGSYAATSNWYDVAWTKRKPVVIDNSNNSSPLTNYPVQVDVAYVSPMQTNFNDIRFTDSDGTTLLNYYLEKKTDSTSATFWVKLPSVSASSSYVVHLYYGNSEASGSSSFSNVFSGSDFSTDFGTLTAKTSGASTVSEVLAETTDISSARYRRVWTETENAVIKGADIGYNQVRDSALLKDTQNRAVKENGKYVIYFWGRITASGVIDGFRAESSDLIHWSDFRKVISHGPTGFGTARTMIGSVIKFGPNDYRTWVNGDTGSPYVYLAVSSDGINWTKQQDITMDTGTLGQVTVTVLSNGKFVMVLEKQYTGDAHWRPYAYTSDDAQTWTPLNNGNALVDLGAAGQWDESHVANPKLMELSNGTFLLEYNGGTGSNFYFQIGFATASAVAGPYTKDNTNPIIGRSKTPSNYGVETGTWELDENGQNSIFFNQVFYPNDSQTSYIDKITPILSKGALLSSYVTADSSFIGEVLDSSPFIAASKTWLAAGRDNENTTLPILSIYDSVAVPDSNTFASLSGNRRIEVSRITRSSQASAGDIDILYWDAGGTSHSWTGSAWSTTTTPVAADAERPINAQITDDGANFTVLVKYADDDTIVTKASIAKSSVKSFSNGRVLLVGDPFTDVYAGQLYVNSAAVRPYTSTNPYVSLGSVETPTSTPTPTPTSTPSVTPSESNVIPTTEQIVEEITDTLHNYYTSQPMASFTMTSDNITNSTVVFDASGSTSNKGIIKYEWDFGDGTIAEGIRVEHKYQSPGQYIVKLTVTDRAGNKNTTTKTVEVKPNAPTITNITAKGSNLWIEGKSDPDTIIYFTIHSNPFEGQGLADKNGYWTYNLENASDTLGEGDHTIFALAAVKLADNSEIRGAESKTYDFNLTVDNGKLKVEMQKTRTWQYIALGLGLIIVLGAVFVLRKRSRRTY